MTKSTIGAERISPLNGAALNRDGAYVLYWMISSRRTQWNFALQRAASIAAELGRGVVILEALRLDYPWASERLHRFVIDGMVDNLSTVRGVPGVTYHPYVEEHLGAGRGLLEALGEQAAAVVTDDFPTFFVPQMLDVSSKRLSVGLEAIDANG